MTPPGAPARSAPAHGALVRGALVRGALVRGALVRGALAWLPGVVALAGCAATVRYYGISAGDVAKFAGYLLLAVAIPGVLLWRATGLGSGVLVEELAAGTAVGYAVGVGSYLAARASGVPNLSLSAPAVIITVFVAAPRLRRHWRGGRVRAPAGWAWFMTAVVGVVLVWSAISFFKPYGLTPPADQTPYVDLPFHLALVGELKNHALPHVPYVAGQPLDYHWFVYANLAGTSWATGIETQVLLLRLALLPMILVTLVLLGATARRLTGRWWASAAMVALLLLFYPPDPYGWTRPAVPSGTLVLPWLSPTQGFGATIFAALTLLLVQLVGGRRRPADPTGPPGRRAFAWVLLTGLLFAVAGAKATFLPLLACGLVAVVAWDGLFNRRLNRAALLALAPTIAALAFAQLVLFGGGNGGLIWAPLTTIKVATPIAVGTGLATWTPPGLALTVATVLTILLWAAGIAGIAGLALRGAWRDPAVPLALGIGLAGIGAALVFNQSGSSQLYFWASGTPYLQLLSIVGLSAAISARRPTWRAWLALLLAAAAGVAVVHVLRTHTGRAVPRTGGRWELVWAQIVAPIGWLLLAAVLIGVAVYAAQRLRAGRRGLGLAVGAAAISLMAAGLVPFAVDTSRTLTGRVRASGWGYAPLSTRITVPPGGVAAARWLRDHSAPGDLVATNAHCASPAREARCDNRNFWISGYAERHVLVEGWGYTDTANEEFAKTGVNSRYVPFWDPDLLAANDAAFADPSAASVGDLRDRYGVRWMFVDERYPHSADLDRFAARRFASGDVAVYETAP